MRWWGWGNVCTMLVSRTSSERKVVVVLSVFFWLKLIFSGGGSFMNTKINVRFHKRRTFCTQLSGCHLFKKLLAIVEIKLLFARFLKLLSFSKKKQNFSVCRIPLWYTSKGWTGGLPKFCLEWNLWLGAEGMSGVL